MKHFILRTLSYKDLVKVRLADVLPSVALDKHRTRTLTGFLVTHPDADLTDVSSLGGIGPATIVKLYAAGMKSDNISRARAHGIDAGVCPCSFTEENVGAQMAALVEDDCGPHIPGCAYIAEHGHDSIEEAAK